jgi:hypothetical protein
MTDYSSNKASPPILEKISLKFTESLYLGLVLVHPRIPESGTWRRQDEPKGEKVEWMLIFPNISLTLQV